MQPSSTIAPAPREGRLATTFLRPLQTQFLVPDDGHKCTPKRLIDFCINLPLPDEPESRELKTTADSLVCSMFASVENQKRFFHLKTKTTFPLKVCHLLLRCKYLSKENSWKELAFNSKLTVWSKVDVSLFWVRKDLIQHDNHYPDRYRILIDFDLVHVEWFPPESPFYQTKSTQIYNEGLSPKKMKSVPSSSENNHPPEANLILEVEGRHLFTFADILSAVSPVFAKMLNNTDYVEGSKKTVYLPGKSAADIEELLRLIHPATPHKMTLRYAPALLTLAEEYQIDHIKETAEELIVHSFAAMQEERENNGSVEEIKPSAIEGYALARLYNCSRLEKTCLALLMEWSVEQIEGHPVFKKMDKEDRCALAMSRMKMMEHNRVLVQQMSQTDFTNSLS